MWKRPFKSQTLVFCSVFFWKQLSSEKKGPLRPWQIGWLLKIFIWTFQWVKATGCLQQGQQWPGGMAGGWENVCGQCFHGRGPLSLFSRLCFCRLWKGKRDLLLPHSRCSRQKFSPTRSKVFRSIYTTWLYSASCPDLCRDTPSSQALVVLPTWTCDSNTKAVCLMAGMALE